MKVIYQLEQAIYTNIMQSENLASVIKGVFFTNQDNAELPYILIDNVEMNNICLHEDIEYEVKFNLSLFIRDMSSEALYEMHENIKKAITINYLSLADYNVKNINEVRMRVHNGKDLVTTKLEIEYYARLGRFDPISF